MVKDYSSLKHLITAQPEAAQAAVDELRSELRKAVDEVRQIVHDLRPPSLDELGLRGAVEHLIQKVAADAAQPLITLELPELPDLPPATEVAAYRIIQEALTNALKHAQAQHFVITVRLGEHLLIILRDDGDGLPESYRAGVGLHSMRERAEALGGRFTVSTGPGTTIWVELPLLAGQVTA